jgi:hypothetical protein
MALKYYIKFNYKQASRSVFEDHEDESYKLCHYLNLISPTYTYINWVNDIIFLEYENFSFNEAINFFNNRL